MAQVASQGRTLHVLHSLVPGLAQLIGTSSMLIRTVSNNKLGED